jgi:DNA polymerase sigma
MTSGALWIALLRYYTEQFNYHENIVTIRQYELLPRVNKGWFSNMIAIEDPFELSRNLAQHLSIQSEGLNTTEI